MEKWFLTLILISAWAISAQEKQQLLDSIIKINELHSECRFMDCREWEQYRNWERLSKKLTSKEMSALSGDQNPVLRMYAKRELLLSGKGDAAIFFADELLRNDVVTEAEACLMGEEYTYSIVYHDYWNMIRMEARDSTNGSDEESIKNAVAGRLQQDYKMVELDSIVLSQDNIDWLLYERAFTNRKFSEQYLPRIEKLAFEYNNIYALDHLDRYYHERYKKRIASYWRNDFLKSDFNDWNGMFHYNAAIEILLDSNDDHLKQIAITKLKLDRSWKEDEEWFETTLERHGYSLTDVAE